MDKFSELLKLDKKELSQKVSILRKESLNLRFQKSSGQLEKTARIPRMSAMRSPKNPKELKGTHKVHWLELIHKTHLAAMKPSPSFDQVRDGPKLLFADYLALKEYAPRPVKELIILDFVI